MKPLLLFCFAFTVLVLLAACHRCKSSNNPECSNYNPCTSVNSVKADFTMKEACYSSQACGAYWQDYQTNISDGGWIQFTCNNDSTDSCEWHIGAGVYYGHQIHLSFGTAPNGASIPITLIVKQHLVTLCADSNNSVDTIVKILTTDFTTKLCYGQWQGSFSSNPTLTSIVNIGKVYIAAAQDTFFYVSGLISNYDSVASSLHSYYTIARQESAFQIDGNGTYNIYGDALTDSAGQNIQINFNYLDTPGYQLVHKIFTGKRI